MPHTNNTSKNSTPRDRRRSHTRRRAFARLSTLLRNASGVHPVGTDALFRKIAISCHVDVNQFSAQQVVTVSGVITFICVLNGIWYSPAAMHEFRTANEMFRGLGRRSIVVPQRALERLFDRSSPDATRFFHELIHASGDGSSMTPCRAGTHHDPTGCNANFIVTGRHCLA